MAEFSSLPERVAHKGMIAIGGAVILGCALVGYAFHEHESAQDLAEQNARQAATLTSTQRQIVDLSDKVDTLVTRDQAQAAQAAQLAAQPAVAHRGVAGHRADDPRFKKLQSQLEAQGKAIDDTRADLQSTQGNLDSTRTELSGSIAHTHDELVMLQKKGERNYAEFDITKSKQFNRAGSVQLRLKKADGRHQFADLDLMVNDRNLSQKHVNLFQPVMFYMPDSPQPIEIVINDIGKDHIHGYVSTSKYRQSELASMSNATDNSAQDGNQVNPTDQPAQRKKLTLPQ
jgi:F0F1-type ATP synthase membrane subunit c/vacuolar-type H+-ATPase subunit K